MEQINNDQIITATEVYSCSSSMSTAINEKTLGSDDIINDISIQLERSELTQYSTSAKNSVYVEWHGINYSISEEHNARLRLPRELSRRDKLKQVEIRILHSKILKEFAVKQKKLLLWLSTNLHLKNRNSCENFQKGGWIMNNNSSGDILKELKVSELNLIIITILIAFALSLNLEAWFPTLPCIILRFEEHQNGFGAEWTHKYQPLRIIESEQIDDIYLKLNKTLDYMKKYGIDNVRGSAFSKVNLSTEKQVIYQLLSYILKNIPMSSLLNTAAFWTL
ncbi:hypothetical protein RhiirA5_414516 [Rhizophagus irregularis]|uniref:Uncharacterized protein n=1 Tax=Rhizophagus irregularis TaxID=588596 RepID=A0A2N0SLE9_9GLOM|nr:hypothetical protein RhiirA5_414516 [Rhizophagus irregularis]PKC76401.1 hypothetical protein RhiirA1_447704 [Rhizophagus irregularis]